MPDQEEFHRSVGRLAHNAARLEFSVALLMWGLVGVDQAVGRRVLTNDVARMLPVINRELEHRVSDPALRARVEAWVSNVREEWRERSRILHSVWVPDERAAEPTFMRATLKPQSLRPEDPEETLTVGEVAATADRMAILAQSQFGAFLWEVVATAPGPWSVVGSPSE